MPSNIKRRMLALVLSCGALLAVAAHANAESLIELLKRPGHVAFMRHALAPFGTAPRETAVTADSLGDCATQRNLDERGRADARRIGEVFNQQGVTFDHAYTSKWCRCRETAELIIGRPVESLGLINSYYTKPRQDEGAGSDRRAQVLSPHYLHKERAPSARALMVTHGSLIQDLTGLAVREAEIVVVKADGKGGVTVIARGKP
jgi:phosphohistidine phosphatase SixA